MSLLAKLKSILGLRGDTENGQDVGVTVERDPESGREDSQTESKTPTAGSNTEHGIDASAGETSSNRPEPESGHARASTGDAGTAGRRDKSPSESSRARAQADSTGGTITEEPDHSENGTPVTEIKGIGDAYGERLNGAGVEFVEQLAEADPASLAKQTEIAEGRLEGWIDKAKKY